MILISQPEVKVNVDRGPSIIERLPSTPELSVLTNVIDLLVFQSSTPVSSLSVPLYFIPLMLIEKESFDDSTLPRLAFVNSIFVTLPFIFGKTVNSIS